MNRLAFIFIFFVFGKMLCGDYGKFRVEIYNLTECKSSTRNIALTSKVTWVKQPNGTDSMFVRAEIKRLIGPFGMRIKVSRWDPASKRYSSLLNYRMSNICEGVLSGHIFQHVPFLNKNCTLSKGTVTYIVADYDEIMHQLVGDSFFYGTYHYHFDLTAQGTGAGGGSCMCTKSVSIYSPIE